MTRLTEDDIEEIKKEFGETFIPDEEQESKRKVKKAPLIEPDWDFDEWKPGMTDRFSPFIGDIPKEETEGKGCYDRKIGRRRNEKEPGEFYKGHQVEEKEDENDPDLEYYDLRIPPIPTVEEYCRYKWAKVDCDIEDELTNDDTIEVNQWPCFWYVKGDDPW